MALKNDRLRVAKPPEPSPGRGFDSTFMPGSG